MKEPKIICFKRERQWMLAVEAPAEARDLAAAQNGCRLMQDEYEEACWLLREASGQVVVRWSEAGEAREAKIALGEEGCILFRLGNLARNKGRRVKTAAAGAYLVVAPADWERDEARAGRPIVAPEPVSVAGFRAHFFVLEKGGDGRIAFRIPSPPPSPLAPRLAP